MTNSDKFWINTAKKNSKLDTAMTIGAIITIFFGGIIIGRNKRDREWGKYISEMVEEKNS